MNIIETLFENLVFTKVYTKDIFDVYAAQIVSSFSNENKNYILAFVPVSFDNPQQSRLKNIAWKNIQSRTIPIDYKIRAQAWNPPVGVKLHLTLVERNMQMSKYSCDAPLEFIMLHDPKKKTSYQWPASLNIVAAINSFACICTPIIQNHSVIDSDDTVMMVEEQPLPQKRRMQFQEQPSVIYRQQLQKPEKINSDFELL